MKLISLNIWGGKQFEQLIEYVATQAKDTDIFCFQEVFHTPTENQIVGDGYRANIFSELQKILPDHVGYFAPAYRCRKDFIGPVDYMLQYGLAMFIKKDLVINKMDEIYLYGHHDSNYQDSSLPPRNLQYASLDIDGQEYTIAHFHGIWTGRGKTDTEERLEQSKKARELLNKLSGKKIVCGDFNLLPDTKSLAILEEGLVNLIRTHGITTTRSALYKKPDRYADYTLVSPDITVESFAVPYTEASDHLPMELVFK